MEEDRKNDFPTGSSGGGGKRGYGVRPSFLIPFSGDESLPNTSGESSENRNAINIPNRPPANSDGNVRNWRVGQGNGVERARLNGSNDNHSSTSSSSDHEFRLHNDRDVEGRNRLDNVELAGRPGGVSYAAYIGIDNFVRFPNVQGAFGYAGQVGAPVHEQRGLALRLNGSNAGEYNARLGINNAAGHGVHGGNNAGPPRNAAFAGMYDARFDGGQNVNRINNGSVFYYTTTTAYAHQSHNGEILSEMLSLRDGHIFNIVAAVTTTEYAVTIIQICNNADLVEAMINHLDCLKALLVRNIPLALAKQIACVNAVMRLLNAAYALQEEWTFPVIRTVSYDLSIISQRAATTGCRGPPILQYDWTINTVICLVHPANCRCHIRIYRTRWFYRRF